MEISDRQGEAEERLAQKHEKEWKRYGNTHGPKIEKDITHALNAYSRKAERIGKRLEKSPNVRKAEKAF